MIAGAVDQFTLSGKCQLIIPFLMKIVIQDDDEADTVGCCTLKVENVELVPPNKLKVESIMRTVSHLFAEWS